MVSDSVNANANAGIQSAPKDLSNKKKRANRNARLKQCKLDARREQWLSQVGKVKGGWKEEGNGDHVPSVQSKQDLENSEERQRGVAEMNQDVHHNEDSDSDSFSTSPTRAGRVLSDKDLESNFTASSSSSSSGSSYSGSLTEAEEDDEVGNNGCLDDWEAMADALETNDRREIPSSDQRMERDSVEIDYSCKSTGDSSLGLLGSMPDADIRREGRTRAWRFDDASRPQCLPNLSKQFSVSNSVCFPKPPCPICCEDLDDIEVSFLPCLCGFRLCLFCHKRILEEDGRCPGCRKPYEKNYIDSEASVNSGNPTIQYDPSCSVITMSYKKLSFVK